METLSLFWKTDFFFLGGGRNITADTYKVLSMNQSLFYELYMYI